MILKTYVNPPIDNNNYLLIDEDSKEAALIDCSCVNENLKKDLNEYKANLKYILLTHGHFDHIAGIRPDTTAQVVMNKNDLNWLNKVNQYLPMFGMPEITIPKIDIFVEDGSKLMLGDNDIKVIHTPGHTQGGVCYLVDGKLFSGDTIFRESVGRTDLEGGDFDQIIDSITNKIFTLPPDTLIYPGHGRMTSVEWEKEHNRFI